MTPDNIIPFPFDMIFEPAPPEGMQTIEVKREFPYGVWHQPYLAWRSPEPVTQSSYTTNLPRVERVAAKAERCAERVRRLVMARKCNKSYRRTQSHWRKGVALLVSVGIPLAYAQETVTLWADIQ